MPESTESTPYALVHTARFQVRWADMDALGHVNNAVYFTYVEQARIESLGHLMDTWHSAGTGPVLVHAAMTYKRPIKHPATALVRVYLGPPGRSSLPNRYEITVEGDEADALRRGRGRAGVGGLGERAPVLAPAAAPRRRRAAPGGSGSGRRPGRERGVKPIRLGREPGGVFEAVFPVLRKRAPAVERAHERAHERPDRTARRRRR